MRAPGAPLPWASKPCGPGRMSSYAGRAPQPGCRGTMGAARSRAWRPVVSSGLMTCPPGGGKDRAGWETCHPAVPWSAHPTGSSGVAVRQDSTRGGCQAACFEKTPAPAGTERLAQPSLAPRIGALAGPPGTARAPRLRRGLTRHRDTRHDRCRGQGGGRPRAGGAVKPAALLVVRAVARHPSASPWARGGGRASPRGRPRPTGPRVRGLWRAIGRLWAPASSATRRLARLPTRWGVG